MPRTLFGDGRLVKQDLQAMKALYFTLETSGSTMTMAEMRKEATKAQWKTGKINQGLAALYLT
jgi:hypothetical protein